VLAVRPTGNDGFVVGARECTGDAGPDGSDTSVGSLPSVGGRDTPPVVVVQSSSAAWSVVSAVVWSVVSAVEFSRLPVV
jgi:hypothetical protein